MYSALLFNPNSFLVWALGQQSDTLVFVNEWERESLSPAYPEQKSV